MLTYALIGVVAFLVFLFPDSLLGLGETRPVSFPTTWRRLGEIGHRFGLERPERKLSRLNSAFSTWERKTGPNRSGVPWTKSLKFCSLMFTRFQPLQKIRSSTD